MFIELCCRQYSHSRAFSSENTSFATHLVLFQLCSGRPQKRWNLWNSDSLVVHWFIYSFIKERGFLGGSDGKESACNTEDPQKIEPEDPSSFPGLGRSPGEENGNPLQYPCLKNSMDRGARWATVHAVAKSQTWLSDYTLLHFIL